MRPFQQQYRQIPVRRRFESTEDHLNDPEQFPTLELRRVDADAVRPRPTFDTHDHGPAAAHRSYLLCPARRYVVRPRDTVPIATGWALHGYPAATHSVLLRLNVTATRSHLGITLSSIDSMLGQPGSLDQIVVPVTNQHPRDDAFLGPEDLLFEICMVPKQSFCILPHEE